jgi:hypothetical protein
LATPNSHALNQGQNVETQNLDSINANLQNLKQKNVETQNPETVNANPLNPEQENVETENPETANANPPNPDSENLKPGTWKRKTRNRNRHTNTRHKSVANWLCQFAQATCNIRFVHTKRMLLGFLATPNSHALNQRQNVRTANRENVKLRFSKCQSAKPRTRKRGN